MKSKIIFSAFVILLVALSFNAKAQTEQKPEHKIVFQLVTGDTIAHKQLMKQFGNILSVSPTTKIEVVCHGPGLEMLMPEKSIVTEKVKSFIVKGVVFNSCEFSMKERNVDRARILSEATYVKAGIIEIVSKQEQGWSYIKAGF